jgi:ribosomal protein L7/L12
VARQAEELTEILGYLKGQMALKNATITIEVPEDAACRTGLEDRLDALLQQASSAPAPAPAAPWSTSPELCRLAREPSQKLTAIKVYRELTGASLLEAKNAVEAFIASGD